MTFLVVIRNNALRYLWNSEVKTDSEKVSSLLTTIFITVEEDLFQLLKDESDDPIAPIVCSDKLNSLFPRELRHQLMQTIDSDGTGFVTTSKINAVVQWIPRDATLLELIYLLQQQFGRIILPSTHQRIEEEKVLSAANAKIRLILRQESSVDGGSRLQSFSPFEFRVPDDEYSDEVGTVLILLKLRLFLMIFYHQYVAIDCCSLQRCS